MSPEEIQASEELAEQLKDEPIKEAVQGITRRIVFEFESKSTGSIEKRLLLDELMRLEEYLKCVQSDSINLYIGIEGA
jgi:hypothetical protein